jgi:hypothetical protein
MYLLKVAEFVYAAYARDDRNQLCFLGIFHMQHLTAANMCGGVDTATGLPTELPEPPEPPDPLELT